MKIAVCSDLHLEFGPIVLENTEGADVLVLSGDICVAKDLMEHNTAFANKSETIHDFFYTCCNNFPHVVYVAGNHEHYHGDFKYTIRHLKEMLYYLPNLQILDKQCWTLFGEYVFIGGTLWTDMNKGDPLTLFHIKSMMNDFNCVTNSNRMITKEYPLYEKNLLYTPDGKNGGTYIKDEYGNMKIAGYTKKEVPSKFSPEDAVVEHDKMKDYIKAVIENNPTGKFIVVGHHTPSPFSIHPKYAHDQLMNGGYTSDLIDFILDRPQIKLWTHGHTHEQFDYMIGSTRVVCNPRGYDGYEDCADHFKLKFVDV